MFPDICVHHHIQVENEEKESTIVCMHRRKLGFVILNILSYFKERKRKKEEDKKKGEKKRGIKKERERKGKKK